MTVSEDLEALKLFNEKAETLNNSDFVKFLLEEARLTIVGQKDKSIRAETRWPDGEATRAFILTFRFFWQKSERCSIQNVAEIYERLPISEENKRRFKNSQSLLNKLLDSELPVKVDNETITVRRMLEMFMYGDLAHANRKKRELLHQWMSHQLAYEFVYDVFIHILGIVVGFTNYIQGLNEEVIKELSEKK